MLKSQMLNVTSVECEIKLGWNRLSFGKTIYIYIFKSFECQWSYQWKYFCEIQKIS